MHFYFDKVTGIVFHAQKDPVGVTESKLYSDRGVLNRNRDSWDTIEIANSDITFESNTYKIENGKLEYVSDFKANIIKWENIRTKRNHLLSLSDTESGIQLFDFWKNKSLEEKTLWLKYRKSLRNLPTDFDNPDSVIFPEQPYDLIDKKNRGLFDSDEWATISLIDSADSELLDLL